MKLSEEQLLRYSRNIALKNFGIMGQKKLLSSKVVIAGAGGLGSPVITYLAGAGVGHIKIIDSDIVHPSNLNRQFLHNIKDLDRFKADSAKEFIEQINPDTKIEVNTTRITIDNVLDLISDCDCVVDCLDTIQLKFLLNDACVEAKKTLIHGGAVSFEGQLVVIIPGETACLRCVFPDYPAKIKLPGASKIGALGPCLGVIGSLEAGETIKYLTGLPVFKNKMLIYNSMEISFKIINIKKAPGCPICSAGKMADKEEYAITRTVKD